MFIFKGMKLTHFFFEVFRNLNVIQFVLFLFLLVVTIRIEKIFIIDIGCLNIRCLLSTAFWFLWVLRASCQSVHSVLLPFNRVNSVYWIDLLNSTTSVWSCTSSIEEYTRTREPKSFISPSLPSVSPIRPLFMVFIFLNCFHEVSFRNNPFLISQVVPVDAPFLKV